MRKSKLTLLLLVAVGFITAGMAYAGGCCGCGGNDNNDQFASGLQSQILLTGLTQRQTGVQGNAAQLGPFF